MMRRKLNVNSYRFVQEFASMRIAESQRLELEVRVGDYCVCFVVKMWVTRTALFTFFAMI